MRIRFSPRRSLLGASAILFAASSLALLTPDDASAARRLTWGRYKFYSDASRTVQVGQCEVNYHCLNGRVACWGTQTEYQTSELVMYC
jgi:hypothetical protein